MALAYGGFHALSHELRFLLFEIGIGLPQNSIDYFITLAHKDSLKRLQHAALAEGLINSPIASHHVHDFISQLEIKLKDSEPSSQFLQWNTIRTELDESIANEALAQAYKQYWQSQLRQEARQYPSLWSWINNTQTANQSLLFLEQWGCQGIPYHPTFRAKIGLTRREVLQNSPEFQAKLSIHWCALNKAHAYSPPQSLDFNHLIAQHFPRDYQLWCEKLIFNHLNPEEYSPIPVHPWQWRNKLKKLGEQLLDNKSLLLFPHHQTIMPSNSFNSVIPSNNSSYHIKLAAGIHTPEAKDIETADLIQFGPTISHWINTLLAQSQHYQNTLFLMSNLANIKSNHEHLRKDLSASLHENPVRLITTNQRLVPLASLFATSSITNSPLVIEIIQASGLNFVDYFKQYCHKVLYGQLHLMLKFGIAFATSLNNILVIFSDNKPEGLIIRDLEHIKINDHIFFKDNKCPTLPSDTRFKTKNLDELRTYFIQGVLQNNISYWIDILCTVYHLKANHLWGIVKQVIQTVFNELPKDIDTHVLNWQKHHLLHAQWQHQCLLTMRLKGNQNKNIYIKQINPLNS